MKRSKLLIVIIGMIVLIAGCEKKSEASVAKHTAPQSEKLIYYTCPMDSHKHVHHREPGQCEECGMKLVAGVITSEDNKDYYGCPMLIHSHIRSDQSGSCNECGMKLKPMRLK